MLAALVAAGNGRFRGTRYGAGYDPSPEINNSHTDPPPHIYADPAFREGFAKLADFDLSFEAWLYHTQIADVAGLADAFPDQRIVMNHFAGPMGIGPYAGRRDEIFPRWRADMRELARRGNMHAKLGGLGMIVNGYKFEERAAPPGSAELAETWRPWFETCIEAFGPERCMFESNFRWTRSHRATRSTGTPSSASPPGRRRTRSGRCSTTPPPGSTSSTCRAADRARRRKPAAREPAARRAKKRG